MNGELISDRLQLKPFSNNDLELLHSIFIDDSVKEFLWDGITIPKSQTQEILIANDLQFTKEQAGLWKVELIESGKTIGFVGLWYFFNEPQPQLIYGLLPEFVGQGYASEGSRLIVDYAFGVLGFNHLCAATDKPHLKSQRVLTRLGFEFVEEKSMDKKPTWFYKKVSPVF